MQFHRGLVWFTTWLNPCMNLDWPGEGGQGGSEADERRGALNDRDHHYYITSVKVTDCRVSPGSIYWRHSLCAHVLSSAMPRNGRNTGATVLLHTCTHIRRQIFMKARKWTTYVSAEPQTHSSHLGYISGLRDHGFGFSKTVKQLRPPRRIGFLLHSSDPAG